MPKFDHRLIAILLTLILALSISHATAAPVGQYEGITLTALIAEDASLDLCIQTAADDFAVETGAFVEVVNVESNETLRREAMAALVGGTGKYDIISVAESWLGEFAGPGYLISLDGYMADDDPEDLEDMLPNAMALYGRWYDNQVALPVSGEAMLLFYRTDIFDERGLNPPETWEEYKTLTTELNIPGMDLTAVGFNENPLSLWANRYWGLGGGSLHLDDLGPIELDHRAAIDALIDLKEVRDGLPPPTRDSDIDRATSRFLEGSIVMIETWPSIVSHQLLSPEFEDSDIIDKIDAAQIPGGIPYSQGWGLGISNESLNPDIAYEFIRWVTSPYYDHQCFISFGKHPVRTSTYEELADMAFTDFWADPLQEAILNANAGPRTSLARDHLNSIVLDFLSGKFDAERAVVEMEASLANFTQ